MGVASLSDDYTGKRSLLLEIELSQDARRLRRLLLTAPCEKEKDVLFAAVLRVCEMLGDLQP